MSRLAPTSMPRVGSSAISTPGSIRSDRANRSFCWLPPDSDPAGASTRSVPSTLSERGPHLRPLGAAPDEAEALEPAQAGQADVLADRAGGG